MSDQHTQTTKPSPTAASNAAEAATHRAAEAAQQGARNASEAMRHGADATADVARHGVSAGADAAHRVTGTATDTVRRSAMAMADSQHQIAHEAAGKFEETSRKIAESAKGSTESMRHLLTLPKAAEGGLKEMHESVTSLVEGVVQTNLRMTNELFRLTSPMAVVELQQRFVREYLDTLMEGTLSLVQAVRRTADETLGSLERHVEHRRRDEHFSQAAE